MLGALGLTFESYGQGWAEAAWVPTELACNPQRGVHGGVFGTIHDAAMNFAVNSALESGDRAATLEVSYQTIRPAAAADSLSVRGEVLRLAKQVGYAESAVHDAEGQLISRAAATFLLRRKAT